VEGEGQSYRRGGDEKQEGGGPKGKVGVGKGHKKKML